VIKRVHISEGYIRCPCGNKLRVDDRLTIRLGVFLQCISCWRRYSLTSTSRNIIGPDEALGLPVVRYNPGAKAGFDPGSDDDC
jgi:DNA-directed RNA polymerase subunit RPC12/RpoP